MKKRLFLYTIIIIFAGFAGFFSASVYIAYNNNLNLAKDEIREITRVCAGLYNGGTTGGDISALSQYAGETRITVISPDGKVIADSSPLDLGSVENHLDRPEIQAALNNSPAAFLRHSETLGVDLIYYALKINVGEDGGENYVFVRAAVPVAEIHKYLFQSLPLLFIILLAVIVMCLIFTRGTINRITKPFESVENNLRSLLNGEYKPGRIAGSYAEIDEMTREIDEIAVVLQDGFDSLRDEKNKLDYILNNIGDGIFAVDENKNITLINNAALVIFGVTPDITGKNLNYLSAEKTLVSAVEDCVNTANNAILDISLNGKIFLATIKRLPDTGLITAVLSDVTENRENAKRREEFFANASHELKTPLTAIKGFNELTDINNKDENITKYIGGITRETDRMLSLIGDMLKLSELENAQAQSINPVSVSLAGIVNEVKDTMSTVINEKSLTFETVGDGMIKAEQGHIYELAKNLIENAARYTGSGGKVSVTIEGDKKPVRLTVSDNGIGISPGEQARIFERFYRVEKSRSQRSGGTGLGLSIVKHICALYGWKLSLKSKLGVGTEITVIFE